MKLVIGLGNPGEKYASNRHNTGFLVVDKLKTSKFKIFKSDKFMNNSGSFVKKLLSKYPSIPVSSIFIVHDDLDLPLGTWKIQYAKGPKDHGGINDIEQKLGTDNFWRIRVGVDNRKPESLDYARDKAPRGETYVLEDFAKDEKVILDKVIDEVCKKLATF